MSFPNPDNYGNSCECGPTNSTPAPSQIQSQIDALKVSPLVFTNGGTLTMTNGTDGVSGDINTSGHGYNIGGYINTSGSTTPDTDDVDGGYIDTSAVGTFSGGYINTSAGGYINTSAGGYINTSNGGGNIDTGGGDNPGGYISTVGSPTDPGGFINTSSSDGAGGGSLNLSADVNGEFNGGSINLSGTTAGADAPNITCGTNAPTASLPNGSIYLRVNGAASTTLYVRAAGVWVAK